MVATRVIGQSIASADVIELVIVVTTCALRRHPGTWLCAFVISQAKTCPVCGINGVVALVVLDVAVGFCEKTLVRVERRVAKEVTVTVAVRCTLLVIRRKAHFSIPGTGQVIEEWWLVIARIAIICWVTLACLDASRIRVCR